MSEEKIAVALGCDHGGYALKESLKARLIERGYRVEDFGCHSTESCDYPVYAQLAAQAVADGTMTGAWDSSASAARAGTARPATRHSARARDRAFFMRVTPFTS